MIRHHNPADAPAPFGAFSNGIEVPAEARLLFVKGQIGADPDGGLPDGFEAQARNAWKNVIAVLRSAGMEARHLVQVRTHLVRRADYPAFRRIRDGFIGQARPASTTLIAELVDPRWLIEIEAFAAAPK
ncbi:MAG TPA: RidA family protein [Alphaproteobacteria bacterium]|nr:RidA family protein [Alphaproteobacteria bacterium]